MNYIHGLLLRRKNVNYKLLCAEAEEDELSLKFRIEVLSDLRVT